MRAVNRRGRRPAAFKAVAATATLVTALCGSISATVPAEAAGSGDITVGWAQTPDNLDPAITGAQTVESIDVNIFQTLVWLTPSGQLSPDLATAWATSDGGKTYTLTLRKGVTFQDGTPFNAAAVVDNINFITAKSTQSVSAISSLGSCLTASVVSTYKVAIHCKTPYAPLLSNLTNPVLDIQSPTAIKKYGTSSQFHLVGTGPFEEVSYKPNVSLVVKKYPKFNWAPPSLHQNGPADLNQITYDFVPDNGSRVSELLSGQAQLIEQTPTDYYQKLGSESAYRNLAVPISGMGIFMPFDVTRAPTNSEAVRQAISYYVNRPSAIKTALQDAYPQLTTPLEKGTTGYDPNVLQYSYNPTKAASLLTAAGWKKDGGTWTKDGKPLSIILNALSTDPQYPLILQAVQAQLATAGIKASIITEPVTPWENVNATGGMSMTVLEFANSDPAQLLQWFVPGQYFQKWTKVDDPALSTLLNEGETTTSPTQRLAIYGKAQNLIMQEAYEIPFNVNEDLLTMSSKVTGVEYEGGGNDFFYKADLAS
jgi:peptide/nickel transport system substrate-binding protein